MNRIFVLLIALTLPGCIPGAQARDNRGVVAALLAAITSTTVDALPVAPEPTATHRRADCPSDGWITHGDGHRTRCPNCDPPWTEEGPTATPTDCSVRSDTVSEHTTHTDGRVPIPDPPVDTSLLEKPRDARDSVDSDECTTFGCRLRRLFRRR